ncbi:MAG: lysophospholipid acyltransferase family protein [Planctomycetota bacterium]|jgi:1-acyl-sn-glycerol-3-phosphate acyltransferase
MGMVSFENPLARVFYRSLQGFGSMLFGMMFRPKVIGEKNVPSEGPVVVAANHASYLDPILIGIRMRRRIRFVAWNAIFNIPGISFLSDALGAFPVNVDRMERETYAKIRDVLRKGDVLGIFPDGCRTLSGLMEDPKPGAVRLALGVGAPIVPCSVIGVREIWSQKMLLWQAGEATLVFHKPIFFSDEDRKKKRDPAFIDDLNERIKATVNSAITSPPVRRGAPLARARFRKAR